MPVKSKNTKSMALACLACGAEMANDHSGGNQPVGGLAFTSRGHWPSTIFDPMDGSFLEINICDSCLEKAAAAKRVLLGKMVSRPETSYRNWQFPGYPAKKRGLPSLPANVKPEPARIRGRKC